MVDSHIGACEEWARCLVTAPIMKLLTATKLGNNGEDGLAEVIGLIPSSLGHRCRHCWLSSVIASFADHATAVGARLRTAIIEFCHRVSMLSRYRALSLAVALAIAFSLTSETAWGQTTTISTPTTSPQTNSVPLDGFIVTSAGSIAVNSGNGLGSSAPITTLTNNGTISNSGFSGIGIYNTGPITTLTNNGTLSANGAFGIGIYNTGPITTLTNNGTLSTSNQPAYGIANQGTITTLTNTGIISASGSGVYGIYNLSTITTLNNQQGASSSALTYRFSLPTNYNIIIGGTTNYGQLAVTSPSGTMVFGISPSSTITSSMVGQTLTGMLQGFGSTLSTYITSGLTSSNGYTYTLTQQGSTGTWDLTITGGPALTRVTAVAVPSNATYGAGQDLSLTLTYSEAVTVTGTPRLALTIGSTTRYATYVSGSGTTALVFKPERRS